ncbi:DUF4258 domain-containing protein [Candidatus Micrarchaeota archaeon]|nr:DUF4258 domain-containing protein [Candidatus Micrarchaeota archaeon]
MRLSKGELELVFSLHAVFRAEERGIDGRTLKAVVATGSFEKFGKNGLKIVKQTRDGRIVLVCRFLKPGLVKILTVEKAD